MRKEQINPGCSKAIFEFSETEPRISTTEFINGTIVMKEIKFSFDELQFEPEYIRLSVNVDYRLIEDKGDILIPIKNRYSYKIFNGNGIKVEELFAILKNCIQRINVFIKDLYPPLKYVPDLLPELLIQEQHYEDLEKIAEEIENHYRQ